MQVTKKLNKLAQDLNLSRNSMVEEKEIEDNIDLHNECDDATNRHMKNVSITLMGDRESFYFHVNNKQVDKTAISQEELDELYNWLIRENTSSHAVTCNDKSQVILIRNSILFAGAR